MSSVYHNLKRLARIPVILAVIGAYLNSAELLAEFQPAGRAWVGWVGALSVSVALFLCVEAFLHRPSWVTGIAVVGFGLAEMSGNILHAALIREDVVFMTDTMRWVMGYISPSLVVFVGVVMAFVTHYGFGPAEGQTSDIESLNKSISSLVSAISLQVGSPSKHVSRSNGRTKVNPQLSQLPLIETGDGESALS